MNEAFLYGGIVMCFIFLIISIIIFVKYKIPESFVYLIKINKGKKYNNKIYSTNNLTKNKINTSNQLKNSSIHEVEPTEVMDAVQSFAEALLAAEKTEILEELEDTEVI